MSFVTRALGMGVKTPAPPVVPPVPAAPPSAAPPTLANANTAATEAAARTRAAGAMASGFSGTVTNAGGPMGLVEQASTQGRSLLG